MPLGVVKQGEESKWAKAKSLAAQQGHAKDWPYINGIFQKMKGGDEAEKCLQKSELTPWARGAVGQPKFIISTWPGQVPSRMRLEEQKLAKEMAMPMPFHPAMLFNPGGTYLTPASVVDGLGFDRAQESEWRQYLGKAIQTPNELVMRQSILSKMLGDKLDAPRRRALFGRALSFYRDMRKSMVNVVTVDELRKSAGEGSRGGKVIGHKANGDPIYESNRAPAKNTWEYPDEKEARQAQMATAMHMRPEATEIRKSGGEGSRGGKVTGHTSGGAPIYAKSHGEMMQHHARARDAARAAGRHEEANQHMQARNAHRSAIYLPRPGGLHGGSGRPDATEASHSAWEATQRADALGKSDTYGGIVDNREQGDPAGRIARVKQAINNRVANAGPCGLPLDKLGDVVKAHGKKRVADVLTKACAKGGHMVFKKGLLKFRG